MIEGLDLKYTSTGDYILAFIDVLGIKNKVKDNLHETLETLWLINNFLLSMQSKYKELVVRTFSDNYLVALKNNESDFANNFSIINNIIGDLVNRGLRVYNVLIRGAIVRGELHLDDQIVLGPALIKAYELESEIAIYPRILVEKSILNERLTQKQIRDNEYTDYFFQDTDLWWCLNSLKFCKDTIEQALRERLKHNILKQMEEAEKGGNQRVKAKILWLKNYVNCYYMQNHGCLLI